MSPQEKVILVVGICGLDRLVSVERYPRADSKVRSTSYHEVGGGNAGNTASAMALLSHASIFHKANHHFRIKLLAKVGDDTIGTQLKNELDESGVDTTWVFRGEEGSTTGVTTVIVSQGEQTRTCIHTPGTYSPLSTADLESMNLHDLFDNVVHLHSDDRLAEASLFLAKEAHKRNILVSIDAEKDRDVTALDNLLETCDMIFTNASQMQGYLKRRTATLEAEYNRKPLSEPTIDADGRLREACALGIAPCHFFQRWFKGDRGSRQKEVIITKGEQGALHVICDSSCIIAKDADSNDSPSQVHQVTATNDSLNDKVVHVQQHHIEINESKRWIAEYMYKVHHAGVMKEVKVVDTTGAGDAFIGGYVLAQHMPSPPDDCIQFGLEFGAWVAGKKLAGPGARTALPSGQDVDSELGRTTREVCGRLQDVLQPFAFGIN